MSPKLKEAIENLYSLFEEGEVMDIVFLAVNDEKQLCMAIRTNYS